MHRVIGSLVALLLTACGESPTTDSGTGSLAVTIAVSGSGQRPAEFTVSVDGETPLAVPAGSPFELSGITSGSHTVALMAVPGHCTSDWYVPQPVTVPAGGSAGVNFHLDCLVPLTGRLVYAAQRGTPGDYQLYSSAPDGSDERLLSATPGSAEQPRISPSGTRIAWARDGFRDVWVMNVDGTGLHKLTASTDESSPDWSPDGTRLVLVRGGPRRLVIVSADGRQEQVVHTEGPGGSSGGLSTPRWSPDGATIAFTEGKELDLLELATGTVRNVRPPSNNSWVIQPSWAPDGGKLVYVILRSDPSTSGLGMLSLASAQELVILPELPGLQSPEWSRTAGSIAFAGFGVNATFDIFTVHADGTLLRTVSGTALNEIWPTWSP
jgi:hypothetical protein